MYYNNAYGQNFNPEVLKDLSKIYDKIQEEKEKEQPDKEKLLQLKMQQLYRGMELSSGYYNNYRRNIPW